MKNVILLGVVKSSGKLFVLIKYPSKIEQNVAIASAAQSDAPSAVGEVIRQLIGIGIVN